MMTPWEKDFITKQRVARLATVDQDGQPHVVPIVYAFDGERLYTPIDAKSKRVGARQLRRVSNIEANDKVALIIDDYAEDWTQLVWLQIRGSARLVETGMDHTAGLNLLQCKYSQYQTMPLNGKPIIIINPTLVIHWCAGVGDKRL